MYVCVYIYTHIYIYTHTSNIIIHHIMNSMNSIIIIILIITIIIIIIIGNAFNNNTMIILLSTRRRRAKTPSPQTPASVAAAARSQSPGRRARVPPWGGLPRVRMARSDSRVATRRRNASPHVMPGMRILTPRIGQIALVSFPLES